MKIQLLAQLVQTNADLVQKLEKSYNQKDLEEFNKAKSSILDLQKKISEILSNGS